jgi:hypothetical protein
MPFAGLFMFLAVLSLGITANQAAAAGAALPFCTYDCDEKAVMRYGNSVAELADFYQLTKEAFNHRCIALQTNGSYVEFTATNDANTLLVRYSLPFFTPRANTYTLTVMVNGVSVGKLKMSSHYLHSDPGNDNQYAPAASSLPIAGVMRWWDETFITNLSISKGNTVRLQKQSDDTSSAYYLDLIDLELAPLPLGNQGNKPDSTWVSITEYGAVPNDLGDDYSAIIAALNAARTGGKKVWVPKGRFMISRQISLTAPNYNGITIEGAGMWYSEIYMYRSVAEDINARHMFYLLADNVTVKNIRLDSVANFRRISDGVNRTNTGMHFNGPGNNFHLEKVWTFHQSAPIWLTGNNAVVINNRNRCTYADGYHIEDTASFAVITNNHTRGHGDDGLAIVTHNVCGRNNLLAHNTLDCGYMGRGICIRGGDDNVVEYNLVRWSKSPYGLFLCPYDKGTMSWVNRLIVRGNVFINSGSSDAIKIDPRANTYPDRNFTALITNNFIRNTEGANGLHVVNTGALTHVDVIGNTFQCTGTVYVGCNPPAVNLVNNFDPTALGDPDGDGVPTWAEYWADTDPTNPLSVLAITGITCTNGGVRVVWQGGTGVRQFLQCTTDLTGSAGLWTAIFTNPPPTPILNEYFHPDVTNQSLFYRIQVDKL